MKAKTKYLENEDPKNCYRNGKLCIHGFAANPKQNKAEWKKRVKHLIDFMLKKTTRIKEIAIVYSLLFSTSTSILAAIQKVETLDTLQFRGNTIVHEAAKELAKLIGSHSSLRFVDISNIHIGGDVFIGEEIGKAFRENGKLQVFTCANNPLGVGAVHIGNSIAESEVIMTLDLENTELVDPALVAIAEALQSNTSLHTLNLGRNRALSSHVWKFLGEGIAVHPNLLHLNLRECNLGDYGAISITNGLKSTQYLRQLNLKRNNIGPVGEEAIANALTSNSSLTSLILSYNKLTGFELAKALPESGLVQLSLKKNKIGMAAAIEFGRALSGNQRIEKLSLGDNKFYDEGAEEIFRALQDNFSITELRMSSCGITTEIIPTMTKSLSMNYSLKILNLQKNNIATEGATDIANYLFNNPALQVLHLEGNKIRMEGVNTIASAITHNTNLTEIYFMGNPTHVPGKTVDQIVVALLDNFTILNFGLNLSGMLIREEKVPDLHALLERNRTMKDNIRFKSTKMANHE